MEATRSPSTNVWMKCDIQWNIIWLLKERKFWHKLQHGQFSSLSCVQLFATPWTAAHQASLSITNSWSLLKLMSIEPVLILCHPLLLPSIFPSIRVFSSESVPRIKWPKYCGTASASVLPMNSQDWFPSGLTGLISLQSKQLCKLNPQWDITTQLSKWIKWKIVTITYASDNMKKLDLSMCLWLVGM